MFVLLMSSLRWQAGSILIALLAIPASPLLSAASDGARLAPEISNAEAWQFLPPAKSGGDAPLPSWARMLARDVPRTAAALLELDVAQRTASPIPPKLRAAMRWVGARANGCEYAMQAAALDARTAGLDGVLLSALAQPGYPGWTTPERNALGFAEKMTLASSSVTDDEFSVLIKAFGERQAASMVLLMAFANMQDRMLICLNADPAADLASGALSPVPVVFGPDAYTMVNNHPPLTESLSMAEATGTDVVSDDGKWAALSYDIWQQRLREQRTKPTRLPIPTWEQLEVNLPEGMFNRPSDIVWYRIVFGYAHELAIPFERFMRTAGAESSGTYGRVFGTSLFWVTTRAVECPYCMGHCEMNWEVAGLTAADIARRSQVLASDDWSSFPPAQQRALAFARKLSLTPADISSTDIETLQQDFPREQALLIALNVSRYNYMTRISNGFQLKLESENVFFDYWNLKKPESQTTTSAATQTPSTTADLLTAEAQAIADELRKTLPPDSEATAMLDSILTGEVLDSGDGWFPLAKSQTRFDWQFVSKTYDGDQGGKVSAEEFAGSQDDFSRLDRNRDKSITEADFDWQAHSLTTTPGIMMFFMADQDANGKVTASEFAKLFEKFDADQQGFLAIDDLREQFQPSTSTTPSSRPDRPSPSTLVTSLKNQELGSLQTGPSLNDAAPDFTLKSIQGESVTLSKELGEKPIVLIFGNFTCGPFRSQAGNLEKLYERYQDRAKFFLVYVREAHPSDGWWMLSNQRAGIKLEQPQLDDDRRAVAETCQRHLDLKLPFLVDSVDDKVGAAYSGMPNRLYLIDQAGQIAFKNGRGPFGFHPRQLEQALVLLLNEDR